MSALNNVPVLGRVLLMAQQQGVIPPVHLSYYYTVPTRCISMWTTFRLSFEALLTLVGLGKVKIGLINFDIKIPSKIICIGFKKNTCSCRNFLQIFLNFIQDAKKTMFSHTFWSVYVKNPAMATPHCLSYFRLVLL